MANPTFAKASAGRLVMMRMAGRRKWRRLIRSLVWSQTSVRHYISECGGFECALGL